MELLDFALKIIKDECDRHGSCSECPFRLNNTSRCALTHNTPYNWRLRYEQREEVTDSLFYDQEED